MAQSMEAFRQEELEDMVSKARLNGWQIDKLAEPPLSVPGCDDPKGHFDWFKVVGPDDKLIGHFCTEKGVFA